VLRLRQRLQMLKCNLSHSRQEEAKAKKALAKMRNKQLADTEVTVLQEDVNAVVKKHGGKSREPAAKRTRAKQQLVKKSVKKKGKVDSCSEDDSSDDDRVEKRLSRNRAAAAHAAKQMKLQVDLSEEDSTEDEGPLNFDDELDNEHLESFVVDKVVEVVLGDGDAGLVVPTLEVNTIVEVPRCSLDHSDMTNLVPERLPSFCDEGQKFCDSKCVTCHKDIKGSLRPTSRNPIYHCPHFEDKCDVVLCNKCYSTAIVKEGTKGTTRRSRRL
jgi:hypothetical protein